MGASICCPKLTGVAAPVAPAPTRALDKRGNFGRIHVKSQCQQTNTPFGSFVTLALKLKFKDGNTIRTRENTKEILRLS